MDLSIIIVSYNIYNELRNCITSVYEKLSGLNFEIIVVDNASADMSVQQLNEEFPLVKTYRANSNLGFGAANNLGTGIAAGRNILFLNPDTILKENFVLPILEFIEKKDNVGACGPMLLNQDGSYQSSSGFRMGFLYDLFESFMFISLYRMFRKYFFNKKKHVREPVKVGWVSGACMIIRKDIVQKVKGFSPDFFLNYEDLELCRKLEDHGLRNYYFPYLECIHLDHKSFGSNFNKLIYSRYLSRLKFASKYYSMPGRLFIRISIISGLLIRILLTNIINTGKERKERAKGYRNSLRLCFEEEL